MAAATTRVRSLPGIHHVTAFCKDPQENYDFYAGVLGLRLIKVTVNYDDPGLYHTYFGDSKGTPGTGITFFPIPMAARGRVGRGQVSVVQYSAPAGSLGFWKERLAGAGFHPYDVEDQFGGQAIQVEDPDGMLLELVTPSQPDPRDPGLTGPVAADSAIKGFHGVRLESANPEATRALLVDVMGFTVEGESHEVTRLAAPEGLAGGILDLSKAHHEGRARMGAGSVHHVAWRTDSDESQQWWLERLTAAGMSVTPVRDRNYFHSIYFMEPGGVIFEIATEGPGFAIDEEPGALGTSLKLPPWFESDRDSIVRRLAPWQTREGVAFP